MANIVNASPQIVNLGADDKSIKPTPPRPIVISTHTPLIMGFAASGPAIKTLVDGARLIGLYGIDTFDRKKPYFTHTTRLAELMSAAGNAIMYKRIIPDDNDTIANFILYVDMALTDMPIYVRNIDGSIAYDANGPIVEKDANGTDIIVEGYTLKIVSEFRNIDEDVAMGGLSSKPGMLTDKNGNPSVMYPIYEQRVSYKGSMYNNYGIAINVPSYDQLDQNIKEGAVAMPFEFYIYKREDVTASGSIVKNLFGSETMQFAFKKDARDKLTDRPVELKDIVTEWSNLDNPLRDLVYPVISEPYVYYDNIDFIQGKLMVAESAYVNTNVITADGSTINTSEWFDFITDKPAEDQNGIINFLTTRSSKSVPAYTFALDDSIVTYPADHKEVYISKHTPIWFEKGKDGTLTEATLEAGVREYMDKYLDANSEVMDLALNLENVLYDSGFRLETKKSLINFIALRKDTFVGLTTREDYLGDNYIDLVNERAIAVNLRATLALVPESTFFGTPVSRAMIVSGNGKDNLDPSQKRYSLVMDLAYKTARMMGGTKWKKELIFDRGDKNIILNYTNIQPEFIPSGIKPDLWNIGIIWPQPYDIRTYHFPELQSVYDNDTSVLNNIFMAIALTVTNKVAAAAWRKFTGDVSMGTNEFLDAVETYMNNELTDKFDKVIEVGVKAVITDFDAERGYSWSVVSKLYGNVMKTVMTHYIETWNKEDL